MLPPGRSTRKQPSAVTGWSQPLCIVTACSPSMAVERSTTQALSNAISVAMFSGWMACKALAGVEGLAGCPLGSGVAVCDSVGVCGCAIPGRGSAVGACAHAGEVHIRPSSKAAAAVPTPMVREGTPPRRPPVAEHDVCIWKAPTHPGLPDLASILYSVARGRVLNHACEDAKTMQRADPGVRRGCAAPPSAYIEPGKMIVRQGPGRQG